ncbi:hypothetical protein HZ994_12180 [Akkermansiaceae bacterium]|nr:hypothetical protein HZ994_12180 [Akkermansiaceae bacterium]
MSTPRGIFETFPNQSPPPGAPPSSPFAIASEASATPAPSPFAPAASPAARKESPFSVVGDEIPHDSQKTIRLPERRKSNDSPFQISEPQGFGFEAPDAAPQALRATPFERAPVQQPAPLQASPFQMEQPPAPVQPAAPANPFGGWPQAGFAPQNPVPAQQPAAPAPAPQAAPSGDSANSDSYSIRQLELRAIFGVDREMTKEEIIQRSRSLPGIRQIARVSEQDIAAVDALKQVISNLGFGNGSLKLYSGSVPIEFIREGGILLAVQTDGGFAPGVRETLMLVARELGR